MVKQLLLGVRARAAFSVTGGVVAALTAQGMDGIFENTFLNVKNTSKTIVADVSLSGNDKGIILCQGGKCVISVQGVGHRPHRIFALG